MEMDKKDLDEMLHKALNEDDFAEALDPPALPPPPPVPHLKADKQTLSDLKLLTETIIKNEAANSKSVVSAAYRIDALVRYLEAKQELS